MAVNHKKERKIYGAPTLLTNVNPRNDGHARRNIWSTVPSFNF